MLIEIKCPTLNRDNTGGAGNFEIFLGHRRSVFQPNLFEAVKACRDEVMQAYSKEIKTAIVSTGF
jgi:hypothetical protein